MFAPSQATPLSLDCKVSLQENDNSQNRILYENVDLHDRHYTVVGTFEFQLATMPDVHELDQIEAAIEKVGQEFKRQATRHVLEAADRHVAEVARVANPELHKHGTRPFTIVARYGDVTFNRQRLFNPTNDIAVSERCKHHGMRWTEPGVIAIAAYAENTKQIDENATTFHTIS